MNQLVLTLLITLNLSICFGSEPKSCINSVNPSLILLDQNLLTDIISNPKMHLKKKFYEKELSYGSPFKVILASDISQLKSVISDLNLLSKVPKLREKIFGSSTKHAELATKLLSEPLSLNADIDYYQSSFVEVGVEVFTLDDNTKRYIYLTSNHKNSISVPNEFLSSIIEEIKQQGRSVVALDSFHTHPLNLVPTVSDQEYFTRELKLVKSNHPEISFDQWRMRTILDHHDYLHEVDLVDWLK